MKKFVFILLILSTFFPIQEISAQQKNEKMGHRLVFHIKDSPDQMVYLTVHHRDKLYLRDSARMRESGVFVFEGENLYEDGLYSVISQKRRSYLNFIIDKDYHFEYFLDTTNNVFHFSVKDSPENSEMLAFQQKTQTAQQEMQEVIRKRKEFENAKNQDSVNFYKARQLTINGEMEQFINDLIARNPEYLFSKMQKAFQPIEIPDPPVKADGSIDSNFQHTYYLTHYWDNLDLTDSRFIYLPVLENMYQDYVKKVLFYLHTDSAIKYADLLLSKTEPDTLMFKYILNRLAPDFGNSKALGHDAVFVHIAKKYYLSGEYPGGNEETVSIFQKRVKRWEPLLVGKPAPELIIPDTTEERWISSHSPKEKYVVLWFFDPDCHTCKRESAKLKVLYDSLSTAGSRNFEVYAIGNDSDLDRWRKYVRENKFNWINVGGHTANINYLDVYNIIETGNPTLFILDENRNIILNKRINVDDIPQFLEQHENIKLQLGKKR
ncbi:MAG: DUF5106 domain-containing protein [Bacteroidales bacterium]|jgi:peroxiredoxin|nr:DUF5106 domain-containing protein [Bacteroidales bacterium]